MKNVLFMLVMMSACTVHAASNEVSVTCEVPASLVMFYEAPPIIITVSNGTDKAIPFIVSESYAYHAQFWVDLGYEFQFNHPPNFGLKDRKKWAEPFNAEKWPKDWWLAPGRTGLWTLNREQVFEIVDKASNWGTSNFTVRVQLGNNQWASSPTLSFRAVPRRFSERTDYWKRYRIADFPDAYVAQYDGHPRTNSVSFYNIPLVGKNVLLDNNGNHICEFQNDLIPKIMPDSEKGFVTISFPDDRPFTVSVPIPSPLNGAMTTQLPKEKKRIRYNLNEMQVEPDGSEK